MSLEAVLIRPGNVRDLVTPPESGPYVSRKIWEMNQTQIDSLAIDFKDSINHGNALSYLLDLYIIDPDSEIIRKNRSKLRKLAKKHLAKVNGINEMDYTLTALAALKIIGEEVDPSSVSQDVLDELKKAENIYGFYFVSYAIITGSTHSLDLSLAAKEKARQNAFNLSRKWGIDEACKLIFADINFLSLIDRNKELEEVESKFVKKMLAFCDQLIVSDLDLMVAAKLLAAESVGFADGKLEIRMVKPFTEVSALPLPETRRFV